MSQPVRASVPVESARRSWAGRLSSLRGWRGVGLNVALFVATLALSPLVLVAIALWSGWEKVLHGHIARVKRQLIWVLNLRLPGLLLALLIPLGPLVLVVGVVERARYGQLSRAERRVAVSLLLVALVVAPFVLEEYRFFLLAQAAAFTLIALSVNVLTGYLGEVSLGQGAFVLTGAYIPAMLMAGKFGAFDHGLFVAVLLGMLASGLLGFVVSIPSMRLSGLYLSLVTLSLAVAAPLILKSRYLVDLTDGAVGMVVDQPNPPAWAERFSMLTPERWRYFCVVVPAALLAIVGGSLLRGRLGRTLKAVRDSEVGAQIAGVNAGRYRVIAFMMSSLYAGAGGGLWVLVLGFVSADSFTVLDSINFLTAAVIGGLGSFVGSVMGGLFLAFQPDLNTMIARFIPRGEDLRWGIYGTLVIAVMLLSPRGLGGALYKKR